MSKHLAKIMGWEPLEEQQKKLIALQEQQIQSLQRENELLYQDKLGETKEEFHRMLEEFKRLKEQNARLIDLLDLKTKQALTDEEVQEEVRKYKEKYPDEDEK